MVDPKVCGESICITIEETVALAEYVFKNDEREIAIEGCSLVKRTNPLTE